MGVFYDEFGVKWLGFVLALIVVAICSTIMYARAENLTCKALSEKHKADTKYVLLDGCYIKHGDNWGEVK